ncbi:MAG: LysR family transcriptional regulator [Streptococcaceae bacterium]|jgi:DNA-binding transcriptional LysR family regulator|nr:LysR family transcriptional regulator [Streptococcaceae bacterium]
MEFQNLTVNMLTTFLTINETGSISKASEVLYVDQSSISRRIRQLEDELKVTLFERSSKGVELTHSGKVLQNFAKRFLLDLKQLSQQLSSEEIKLENTRIGTYDSITSNIYPRFFGKQLKNFQEVLISNDTSKLITNFNDGNLDAIIVDGEFEGEIISSANNISLFTEPYYVVYSLMNSNQELINRSKITVDLLKKFEIFLYPATCPIHRKVVATYQNVPLSNIHQIEFSESAISLVLHSEMVTILPKSVAINYVTKNVSKLGMKQLEHKFDRHISLFAKNEQIINLLIEEGLSEDYLN